MTGSGWAGNGWNIFNSAQSLLWAANANGCWWYYPNQTDWNDGPPPTFVVDLRWIGSQSQWALEMFGMTSGSAYSVVVFTHPDSSGCNPHGAYSFSYQTNYGGGLPPTTVGSMSVS
jgi:hypothetical protein